jgi:hypothetical protein
VRLQPLRDARLAVDVELGRQFGPDVHQRRVAR